MSYVNVPVAGLQASIDPTKASTRTLNPHNGLDVPARLDPVDRLIVALDVPTSEEALNLVDRLDGTCRWLKVGLQLFCAAGPDIVRRLRQRGFEVFLDLKLHDIPNTVYGAVCAITDTAATLLTVHAAGGERMMAAAVEAAMHGRIKLLAVTVLTSIDESELYATGVSANLSDHVRRLALSAQQAGITEMVCSANEVAMLRQSLKPDANLVVPGIRAAGGDMRDQRRVATPRQAIESGASMLVVGRPITQADDPAEAASVFLAEIRAASVALKDAYVEEDAPIQAAKGG